MATDEDKLSVELQFALEHICAARAIPWHTMRMYAGRPPGCHEIVVHLVREIGAWRGEEIVGAKYPADWWQALKERFAPAWFLRRWPVRYIENRWRASEFLPNLPLPKDRGVRVDSFCAWQQIPPEEATDGD